MIVLDTNVLSEALRPAPSARVMRWLSEQAARELFLSTITEAETLYGAALLTRGRRQAALRAAVAAILAEDFAGRLLPFDSAAAQAFAEISVERRRKRRPIRHADAQIAAIARCRGAALATRNLPDFAGCGIRLIDPWAHPETRP